MECIGGQMTRCGKIHTLQSYQYITIFWMGWIGWDWIGWMGFDYIML